MTLDETREILKTIAYKDWRFHLGEHKGVRWLQLRFNAPDSVTGKPHAQHGRKWLLSEHMTKSEIVLTAFKAVLTAEEHEIREAFKYFGQAIFNPHINVDQFLEISHLVDIRTPKEIEVGQDA